MRLKGITYDTGTSAGATSTRPSFDPAQVRDEMETIARELRCDGVKITGGDLDRVSLAADYAVEFGLEVWYSPQPCELDAEQMRALFSDASGRAERLRRRGGTEVVLVLGVELSVFAAGFIPGKDRYVRLAALMAPTAELLAGREASITRLNDFLAAAAADARRTFSGPVTYARRPLGGRRLGSVRHRDRRRVSRRLQRRRLSRAGPRDDRARQAGSDRRVRVLHLPWRL